jgi:hypothetical protein
VIAAKSVVLPMPSAANASFNVNANFSGGSSREVLRQAETQVPALASQAVDRAPLRFDRKCRSQIASAGKVQTCERRDASSAPFETRPSLSLLPPCCFNVELHPQPRRR